MMPWDWIGIVTTRRDTRRRTSTTGMISWNPGARELRSRPSRKSTPCSYCLTIRTDSPNPSSASSTTMTTTAIRTPMTTLHSDLVESVARARLQTRQSPPGAALDEARRDDVQLAPALEAVGLDDSFKR